MGKKFQFGLIVLVTYLTIIIHVCDARPTTVEHKEIEGSTLNTSDVIGRKTSAVDEEAVFRFDENTKRESVPFDWISSSSVSVVQHEGKNTENSTASNRPYSIEKEFSKELNETNQSEHDHQLLGQPQNFVPVTQFHNGPFPLPFRPPNDNQGPRNFRQIHQQPQFFIEAPGVGGGGGGGGGPPIYNPIDGHHHRGFSQPANTMHFRPIQPPLRPSSNHHHQRPPIQFFNQGPNNNHHHQPVIHPDDLLINHQSSPAPPQQDLLGSGNFNIIRGGIFADVDNPPPHFRHQQRRPTNDDDFFHAFRDFQPFSNALSVTHYRNMQNSPSTNQGTVTIIKPPEQLMKKLKEQVLKTSLTKKLAPKKS